MPPEGGGLTRDAIRLLRHEEATSAAVKAAMREILEATQAGDTVVLFAASHGLPNAMNKFDIPCCTIRSFRAEGPERRNSRSTS